MDRSWDDARVAFADAGEWFVRMAALVQDRWDRPGLGEWDVRSLVGHTSRSFLTVEMYLDRPAGAVELESAADLLPGHEDHLGRPGCHLASPRCRCRPGG